MKYEGRGGNIRTIKVCFVITDLMTHGAQRVAVSLAKELAARGYQVHIIMANPIIEYDIKHPNIFLHSLNYDPWQQLTILSQPLFYFKLSYKLFYSKRVNHLQDKIKKLGPFATIFSSLPEMNFLCIVAKLPNLYCTIHRDIKGESDFVWIDRRLANKLIGWLKIFRARHFYYRQNIITVSEEMKKRTDCPTGPKEILTAELAQFLSPVGDEEAFANNLRKIIAKPPRIVDKHIAKFDKSVNVRKYLDIIQGQYQPPINQ